MTSIRQRRIFGFVETILFTRLVGRLFEATAWIDLAAELRRNLGHEILTGIRQLKRGRVGRVFTLPPVAEIRAKSGLSQSDFAQLLGVSVRTLQEWEQGRRVPSGPARMLLLIADRNPKLLLEAAA